MYTYSSCYKPQPRAYGLKSNIDRLTFRGRIFFFCPHFTSTTEFYWTKKNWKKLEKAILYTRIIEIPRNTRFWNFDSRHLFRASFSLFIGSRFFIKYILKWGCCKNAVNRARKNCSSNRKFRAGGKSIRKLSVWIC